MTQPGGARWLPALAMLLSFLRPSAAAPQRPVPPDSVLPILLDSVRVTVTRGTGSLARAPAAVTRLNVAALEATRPTVDVQEALAGVPGVTVDNRYNFALGTRIAIRGLGARAAFGVRGVRILVDGIPLTMPDGQSDLTNLDLSSAGRLEVLRGPASALWGNAAGGVISVQTEDPPAGGPSVRLRAIAGDYGRTGRGIANLRKLQGEIGGRFRRGAYLASVSHMMLDGYRDHSRGVQTALNGKLRLLAGHASVLTLILNVADHPVSQNPGSLPADSARLHPTMAWPGNVSTGAGEASRQVQGGVTFTRYTGAGRLDVTAYGLHRRLENPLPYAYIRLRRSGGGVRAALQDSLPMASLETRWTLGMDAELQRDGRLELNNVAGQPGTVTAKDQIDRVYALAPFLQADFNVTQRFLVSAGLRYDRVVFRTTDRYLNDGDQSGFRALGAWSPFAGISMTVSGGLHLYANLASAFETPTTTELINAPPAAGQPCCSGGFNAQLEPERSNSMELGLRGSVSPHLEVDGAIYRLDIRDALVPFQVPGVAGRDFYRNAGRARNRGLELGLRAHLGDAVSSRLAYTYSDFRFVDDGLPEESYDGNRVPGIAPHHLFASLTWRPGPAFSLEVDVDHNSRYYADDANTAAALNPAAAVVGLRASWTLARPSWQVNPFLGINNVTDVRYNSSVVVNAAGGRYYEPAPGRNIYLGMTLGVPCWSSR